MSRKGHGRGKRRRLAIGLLASAIILGIGVVVVLGVVFRYGPLGPFSPVYVLGERPVRMTGTIDKKAVDEGPERAGQLYDLLSRASSPGRNKCVTLGTVALRYPSGKSVDVRVGCCTAWINGESWHVGNSALSQFFNCK
jgi:hypothetical protein